MGSSFSVSVLRQAHGTENQGCEFDVVFFNKLRVRETKLAELIETRKYVVKFVETKVIKTLLIKNYLL